MKISFEENWVKVAIIIILTWFTYSYIQTMKYNSYVECNSKIMVSNFTKDNVAAEAQWYALCDIALTHNLNGMWILP